MAQQIFGKYYELNELVKYKLISYYSDTFPGNNGKDVTIHYIDVKQYDDTGKLMPKVQTKVVKENLVPILKTLEEGAIITAKREGYVTKERICNIELEKSMDFSAIDYDVALDE